MRYGRALAIARRNGRLIELIRSGAYSSPSLAEELEVCEQTIYRDIDFLKHNGYAIQSERHTNGWAYHLIAEPVIGATKSRKRCSLTRGTTQTMTPAGA